MKEALNKSLVTAIDIGSQKILVVLAEIYDNGRYKVLGHGREESKGIRAGSINDADQLFEQLTSALNEALRTARVEREVLGRISTTISGFPVKGRNSQAALPLPGAVVTLQDMKKVTQRAEEALELHDEERLIKSERLAFQIDDQTEEQSVDNPVGMRGSRLTVRLHSAVASAVNAVNRIQLLNRTTLEVQTVLPEGWASGYSCLTEHERKIGVVLLDIGDQTTDIVVFKDNHPRFTETINMGSRMVTERLMGVMHCPESKAEEIKMRLDLSLNDADRTQILYVGSDGMREKRFSKFELSNIAALEIIEIIKRVGEILYKNGWYTVEDGYPRNTLPGGVVITGGGSLMANMPAFFSKVPGIYCDTFATRLGHSHYDGEACIGLNGPRESAVMGLVAFEAERFAMGEDDKADSTIDDSWQARVKRFLKESLIGEY